MPRREYDFFVYILASRSHQLYIGVTNSLMRRIEEHREHRPQTYTARYNIDRLVYYETYQYVNQAIARETELKDWNRQKKLALIESVNSTWSDLSAAWGKMQEVNMKQEQTTADSSAALRNDKRSISNEED